MADGFDIKQLNNFGKNLSSKANNLKNGKESRKFLNKEGSKLTNKQKKSFQSKGIGTGGDDSAAIQKSFKKGKVYKYDGSLAIRSFNSNPLTHLLNNGHRIVTSKDRKSVV